MKLYYLGTCSGTEPMRGRRYTSFIAEIHGAYYWFDAGEGCSHTAVAELGLDITKTEALFVSHPHIDHVGGLPNLLFCLDKLIWRYQTPLANENRLEVFFPNPSLLDAAKALALSGQSGKFRFTLNANEMKDGLLFEDRNLRVHARHNLHMGDPDDGVWRSYSFLLETEEKKVVYSGDVKRIDELDFLIGDGADLLIMETGHHAVRDVCEYAVARGVRNLRLIHHGREILGDVAAAERLCKDYSERSGVSMVVCHDGMAEEF